jgi:hypothetical protein
MGAISQHHKCVLLAVTEKYDIPTNDLKLNIIIQKML